MNANCGRIRCRMELVLTSTFFFCATLLFAQTPSTRPKGGPKAPSPTSAGTGQKPRYKAIWEPINYKQDLQLTDVLFINEKTGWVAGASGSILHTEDGGDTWTAQLGGDPHAPEQPICCLQFIDDKHGWAIRKYANLLRTTDGQTWEQEGEVRSDAGYQFLSDSNGFYAYGDGISHSEDGGRTWKKIYKCQAGMEVDGFSRDVDCSLFYLHFPSASVGYAARDPRIIVKTEDGGGTWKALVGPQEPGDQRVDGLYFTSEGTGFTVRPGRKLYRTDDGGQSWKGVVATAGRKIIFAGQDVGWSFSFKLLSYTTDGGKRWTSREFRFPVDVNAFSLPSPQRGYVVGDHGMIYRYRVVPVEYTSKGMMDAPMMPGAAGTN